MGSTPSKAVRVHRIARGTWNGPSKSEGEDSHLQSDCLKHSLLNAIALGSTSIHALQLDTFNERLTDIPYKPSCVGPGRPYTSSIMEKRSSNGSGKQRADNDSMPQLPEISPEIAEPQVECLVCTDLLPKHEAFRSPCFKHFFCSECLKEMISLAIKDESMYPPSCCKWRIARSTIRSTLTEEELSDFGLAELEYKSKHRLYCPKEGCRKFVQSIEGTFNDMARCRGCTTEICTHCKKEFHEGECPEDKGLAALKELAKGQLWARCPKCSAMVERVDGCNYMECRCHAQFCYRCMKLFNRMGCMCSDSQDAARAHGVVIDYANEAAAT